MSELPRIIGVDDVVIEPAHLFETWLPRKYQERGPEPLTAGIGELAHVGGKYRITMGPDGPPADWWSCFETDCPHVDSIFPHTEEVAVDHMKSLDDETVHELMRGNAVRMLDLDFDR